MAKGKKKATTRKKGGQLDPELVKRVEDSPEGAEGEDLDELFKPEGGDVEELETDSDQDEEEEQPVATDPFFVDDSTEIVTPKLEKVTDQDVEEEVEEEIEEPEEEEPEKEPKKGKKKSTQAAEEEEEEETPPSLDEATLMKLLPEKFQGENLPESLKKWHGSYGELESRQDRIEDELAANQRMLREMARPRAAGTSVKPETDLQKELAIAKEEEAVLNELLSDIDILEDPIGPLKKVYALARRVNAQESRQNIGAYDEMRRRQDEFNRFKAEHPDFDDLKGEMLLVIEADKSLDSPEMVQIVYKKAKNLRAVREAQEAEKATESVLSSDKIKDLIAEVREETLRDAREAADRRETELLAKISGGQAVKGTLSSATTPSPTRKDRTGEGRVKKHIIRTDHGDFDVGDEEVAGIIAADEHDDTSLLNL